MKALGFYFSIRIFNPRLALTKSIRNTQAMIEIVEIVVREGTTGMKKEADIGAGVAN